MEVEISSGDILCRFKEMNPLFESNENIKESVALMMNDIDKALELNTVLKDDSMVLMITSELEMKYNIKFKFILTKLEEEFFSEVTLPMVQTILQLEQTQCLLSDLLKKKDRELQEYKLEKGEISREDLKTEPFDGIVNDTLSDDLMLNVLNKNFLVGTSNQSSYSHETNEFVSEYPKSTKSIKRKIYSAKTSNKKHVL